jgi:hypothetical protein
MADQTPLLPHQETFDDFEDGERDSAYGDEVES